MCTKVEDLRERIIDALLSDPKLGKNYVAWHTENSGECGVTIKYQSQVFEIIIRRTE